MKNLGKDITLLTVDVSKSSHYGYLKSGKGIDIRPFKIENSLEGFNRLQLKAEKFMKRTGSNHLIFGYEPTGSYSKPLVYHMDQLGFPLVQVNPKHTKRVKELVDNSPGKTDQKDPLVIAKVVELGSGLKTCLPKGDYAELRQLIRQDEVLVEDYGRRINYLESIIASVFPEFDLIMKGMKSLTSQEVIYRYPTPELLSKLDEQALGALMNTCSRGRLGLERSKELLKAARNSVGVKEGSTSAAIRIKMEIEHLRLCKRQRNEVLVEIKRVCKKLRDAQLLLSIPGISWKTAAVILSETADMKNYKRATQIEKLAGLNLFELSSGKHIGKRYITKRGRSLLRKTLYLAALRSIRKNGLYRQYYLKRMKEGKNTIKTLTAISKKIIHLMFALIRDQKPYERTNNKIHTLHKSNKVLTESAV